MDSACLRLLLCVLAGCGPAVTVGDEEGGTSGADESSSSEPSTSSTSSAGTTGPATTTTTTTTASTADPTTSDSGDGSSSSGEDEPFVSICGDDGQFGIAMSGTNQQEHEGRAIWMSAVEPSFDDPEGAPDPIVVVMQTTVADGAFEMECPLGLTENSSYPSFAVIIDANDDGECNDGDLAFGQQLFGWLAGLNYSFDGASAYSHENDPPWLVTEDAWQPVDGLMGFNGEPFCDYYVP